jgi:hypothetical protein
MKSTLFTSSLAALLLNLVRAAAGEGTNHGPTAAELQGLKTDDRSTYVDIHQMKMQSFAQGNPYFPGIVAPSGGCVIVAYVNPSGRPLRVSDKTHKGVFCNKDYAGRSQKAGNKPSDVAMWVEEMCSYTSSARGEWVVYG